jgi:hypothetical protein
MVAGWTEEEDVALLNSLIESELIWLYEMNWMGIIIGHRLPVARRQEDIDVPVLWMNVQSRGEKI